MPDVAMVTDDQDEDYDAEAEIDVDEDMEEPQFDKRVENPGTQRGELDHGMTCSSASSHLHVTVNWSLSRRGTFSPRSHMMVILLFGQPLNRSFLAHLNRPDLRNVPSSFSTLCSTRPTRSSSSHRFLSRGP